MHLLWVVASTLVLCSLVFSQPQNDMCENAIVITGVPWSSGTLSIAGATNDGRCSSNVGRRDVWFVYRPTTSQKIVVDTCGSSFDTILMFTEGREPGGTCDNYACIVAGDDNCGTSGALVEDVYPGYTYYFSVISKTGAVGNYDVEVYFPAPSSSSLPIITAPLSSLPYRSTQYVSNSAPDNPCEDEPTFWYEFVPAADVVVQLDTCASSLDTIISVASDVNGVFTCIAENDDSDCPSFAAKITNVSLMKDILYYIYVSAWGNGAGTYTLAITPTAAPAHDTCANAIEIPSIPFDNDYTYFTAATTDFSCFTGGATVNSVGRDVWYSFFSSSSYERVVISSCFSATQSMVYLSSGSCSNKQCWRSDSSSCPFTESYTTGHLSDLSLVASTTYYISLASVSPSGTGHFLLNVYIPPINDECSDSIQISTLPFTYSDSTTYALPDFTCPESFHQLASLSKDVFFRFTPSGVWNNVNINLCDVDYDAALYIASGTCSNLDCIDFNDDACGAGAGSSLSGLTLYPDTTYFIIVSAWAQVGSGSYTLSITGNQYDSCQTAGVISSIPFSFTSDTTGNSLSVPCPDLFDGSSRVMWFTFTPTVNYDHIAIDTCNSNFDPIVYVASGSCISFSCLTGDDDYPGCSNPFGSFIPDISFTAGTTYYILVGGFYDSYGVFTLNLGRAGITIQSPSDGAVFGINQINNIFISGITSSLYSLYPITITLRDSSSNTGDIVLSSTVSSKSSWRVNTPLTSLAEGPIDIIASLIDNFGDTIQTGITIIKDSSSYVSITSPPSSSYVNQANQNNFIVSGSGEPGASVYVTFIASNSASVVSLTVTVSDSGFWTTTTNIASLTSGTIRIIATIRDIYDNTANSDTLFITKDVSVVVSILSPRTNQFLINQARASSLSINGFSDPGVSVYVRVVDSRGANLLSNTVTATPTGTWSLTMSVASLADGILTFTAVATDFIGNIGNSLPVTLTKDASVSPAVVITSPSSGASVGSSFQVMGTAETNTRINLRITDTGTGVISPPMVIAVGGVWSTTVNINNLRSGSITIGGQSQDAAGNTASLSPVIVNKA